MPHDTIVVLLLAVLGFGLGAGAVMALVRRRRSGEAAFVRRRLGGPVAEGDLAGVAPDAAVVVEGLYRSPAPLVTRTERGGAIVNDVDFYATTRDDGAAHVEVGGTTVVLDGPRQVLVGATYDKVSREFVRTVRDGDRVRVRGVLRSEPAPGAPHRAVRLTLSPERDDTWTTRPMPIVAVGASRPAQRWSARVVAAGLAGAVAAVLPYAKVVLDRESHRLAFHTLPPCAFDLEERLRKVDDPWTLRGELAVCPAARTQGVAAWIEGDFARASEAFERAPEHNLTECAAHIAAHRFQLAAREVRAYAARREAQKGRYSDERLMALGCIADALEARTGDGLARTRLRATIDERAMCRVLYADLLTGDERLRVLQGPNLESFWQDIPAMDFAKGRAFDASRRLAEEVRGQGHGFSYASYLYPAGALPGDGYSFGRDFRSDVPIGLVHHLYAAPIPLEQKEYRFMLAGNLALFLAHIGEHDEADQVLRTVRDIPGFEEDPDPRFWLATTYQEMEGTLAELRKTPSRSVPWSGPENLRCLGCGLYATLDMTAARRARAQEKRDEVADAEQGAVLYRFRQAMFDRSITVPLQMLESFNLEKSRLQ